MVTFETVMEIKILHKQGMSSRKNGGVSSQGVQLPAPLAVVASQVTEGQQQEVTKLLE
ncbi:hypothetical protein HTO24_20205, partial [Yersinia pestis subsp. pestis]|uniref:hypothetical protein n=1 Tax=Yersinia pestis TaxID=632 RepID=UPI0018DE2870|nr:hypothetical protein [Yersinia pestis subsp. pestis]